MTFVRLRLVVGALGLLADDLLVLGALRLMPGALLMEGALLLEGAL
jgi:hypothetical protein